MINHAEQPLGAFVPSTTEVCNGSRVGFLPSTADVSGGARRHEPKVAGESSSARGGGGLMGLAGGLRYKMISKCVEDIWKLGSSDPRRVVHCLKVGLALTLVSLFYYMRPLYDGVGGNAMWAVITVVVVFEFTVGATLSKGINRGIATLLAGSLAVGVHYVASKSGEDGEPIVLSIAVFLLGSVATFSRFIPSVKRRYDYGVLIFILTFSMVSVSGYRIDKLMELALQRLSTVGIGGFICIIISLLFYPIWAGDDIHNLVTSNLEKLATSLQGCVLHIFSTIAAPEDALSNTAHLEGYKSVLNSKTIEESLANFARWEPAHGPFNFNYPWKQYLKIGTMSRHCAYCIEALNGCITSLTHQEPHSVRQRLQSVCIDLGDCISEVLRDLASSMKTMTRSLNIDLLVEAMNHGVEQLQDELRSLPETMLEDGVTVMEALPLVAAAALLMEVAARMEDLVSSVGELAELAGFKEMDNQKQKRKDEAPEHHTEMKTVEHV